MTTLVIEPLDIELIQEVTYSGFERISIGAIIPYLYLNNPVADHFTLTVIKSATTIYTSNFTVAQIKTALGTSNNYSHVYYPIIPSSPLSLEKGVYQIKLSASANYLPNNTSYIGWVKQHENEQNAMSYTPIDDRQNSFTIRFKELKEGIQ